MGKTTWSQATFLGNSDPSGFQHGTTYTIRVEWPGLMYLYRIVSQELGDSVTDEYLDKAAIQAEWQFDFPRKGGPDT
jgi:hypothetical protein